MWSLPTTRRKPSWPSFAIALSKDPGGADRALRQRLVADGFTSSEADSIVAMVNNHPDTKPSTLASLELGSGDQPSGQPVVQSLWMLITDLFAAAVPVVPFALLALSAARLTSLAVTFVLLVGLGIGRGLVGHRNIARTVVETVTIAAAAAGAGIGSASSSRSAAGPCRGGAQRTFGTRMTATYRLTNTRCSFSSADAGAPESRPRGGPAGTGLS